MSVDPQNGERDLPFIETTAELLGDSPATPTSESIKTALKRSLDVEKRATQIAFGAVWVGALFWLLAFVFDYTDTGGDKWYYLIGIATAALAMTISTLLAFKPSWTPLLKFGLYEQGQPVSTKRVDDTLHTSPDSETVDPDDTTATRVWKAHFGTRDIGRDVCGAIISRDAYEQEGLFGWTLDHIVPRSQGGADDLTNLRPLHRKNANARGGKPDGEWQCGKNDRANP